MLDDFEWTDVCSIRLGRVQVEDPFPPADAELDAWRERRGERLKELLGPLPAAACSSPPSTDG